MKQLLVVGLLCVVLMVAGCAQEGGDPAAVMESYLQAQVNTDAEAMLQLSCDAWEEQVELQVASFESMDAELQDMACTRGDESDGYVYVDCTGKIVTSYNGETREWPLDAYPYRMAQENGEWVMCGYYGFEG